MTIALTRHQRILFARKKKRLIAKVIY